MRLERGMRNSVAVKPPELRLPDPPLKRAAAAISD
jgi:hypothetical protein